MQKTDQEILTLINDDKNFDRGFGLLVGQFQERLYWHIRRMVTFHEDADDVLQNVFIKVFKNIKGFKADSKLYTWLYRIATNESISYLNKKKRRSEDKSADVSMFHDLKADPFFSADEALITLKCAINNLPPKQQAVFNMRYYDEMSYNDMSSALDTSVGSLKASFHHALKKVEAHLKENMNHVG